MRRQKKDKTLSTKKRSSSNVTATASRKDTRHSPDRSFNGDTYTFTRPFTSTCAQTLRYSYTPTSTADACNQISRLPRADLLAIIVAVVACVFDSGSSSGGGGGGGGGGGLEVKMLSNSRACHAVIHRQYPAPDEKIH